MRLHRNARLTPTGRLLLCQRVRHESWTVVEAAEAAGCSQRTAYKWPARFRNEGPAGLEDRSSRPHRIWATPAAWVRSIEHLRRLRMTGPQIAASLHMAVSTVAVVLGRLGLNRLRLLEPPEPPNRYCRRHPGELIHIDVKKLGRFDRPGHRVAGPGPGRHHKGTGWEAVHVCVDDATRLAYVEVLANEQAETSTGFLERAVGWFAEHGVVVERVITDNGPNFTSHLWARWCRDHHVRHLRTRPYRPQTNGKAERFIQTMLREWAYVASYPSSAIRGQALQPWVMRYNCRRPHGGLGAKTPMEQLALLNNLAGNHN